MYLVISAALAFAVDIEDLSRAEFVDVTASVSFNGYCCAGVLSNVYCLFTAVYISHEVHMKRRAFSKRAVAATAAGFTLLPRHVLGGEGVVSPSEKLNIVGIGIGGQGAGDLKEMAVENIAGLVDVDYKKAANTIKTYPKATLFKDYRVMLDKMGKSVDAVMIATPDHMHAPIAMAAMRAGKHVYVEKPMAHSVEEARVMTAFAKEKGLVTQMGNNGHGGEGLRQIKEWIDAGAIGTVKEVHWLTDKPGDRAGGAGPNTWPEPQEIRLK